jgi:hypothetical protein
MVTQTMPYPVTIKGTLGLPPSRWVWLFKWLLLIPQYFVLCFVGIAAFFVQVYAFFAILFTGKYPRGAFDFNVGVMRWSWRVEFYGYQALGTDKYPPFSLDEDPSYPADLYVQYPEKLNNGLVLVKWLLAIPQLIIAGIFQGGRNWVGLVPLLSLVCAVVNLFTGKIPEDIFKFNIQLDRWTYRVYAYFLLMTDQYPPFRLDN